MDKMKCESSDLTQANIARLAELFPSVVTEARGADGKIRKAVNFEALRQLMSSEVLDGDEAYEFTWVGKKAAIVEAGRPIRKTLRPCPEESKNWDTTENLYIEGDNLDVLKLLQENYLGKVKMIYIDPPYNTGNDFIYRDNFTMDKDEYQEQSGEIVEDEDGEKQRLFRNTDSNGRFHSDWCSMIYPRLMLARNLLSDDGVIFISCDDNEQENLKKICDDVFGNENFIAQLIWERAYAPKNDAKFVSASHDYILMYSKNISEFKIGRLPRTVEADSRYHNPDNDSRGPWKASDMSVKTYTQDCDYKITTPSGRVVEPPAGRCWRLSKNAFLERLHDNRIWFGPDGNNVPAIKRFLSELKYDGMAPISILFYKNVGHSQQGAKETTQLMDGGYFQGPKPIGLIKHLSLLANLLPDSLVLDFFSGSATTAHAVMQLNAEDGGKRKFIMVQLPEECAPDTEAAKAGYKNICEIGKERIRRAGEKIKKDNAGKPGIEKLDIGFRVLKCDSSNMKDVYYAPAEMDQRLLQDTISNIKEDRTDLDLLFGCLVEWGLPLSLPYKTENIYGHAAHFYDYAQSPEDTTALAACFDANISEDAIREIAKRKPLRAVFRDASFADSQNKINAAELFKNYAPDTDVKVI